MSPPELLKQTQLAPADENVTYCHKVLIDAGKGLEDLQAMSSFLFYTLLVLCKEIVAPLKELTNRRREFTG